MKVHNHRLILMLCLCGSHYAFTQQSDHFIATPLLAERLSKDTLFIEMLKVEQQMAQNHINNFHNQNNVNWALVNNKQEREQCKTDEDLKQLLTRAGMTNVEIYISLKAKYLQYMAYVQSNYKQLKDISDLERNLILKEARTLGQRSTSH